MFGLRARYFSCKAVPYVFAAMMCVLGTASASGQIATSTTVSIATNPVYFGQTPVATVTVTAADGSTPTATGINTPYLERDVSCAIQARGHNAAYGANLQNGVASIPLITVAEDPAGNQYALACSYNGSATYAASTATTLPFEIVYCYAWAVNGNGTVSQLDCSTGAVVGTQGTPGAPGSTGGIAVDAARNAWAVTNAANSLLSVSQVFDQYTGIQTGAITSTFTGGGLLQPSAIAIDGAGGVWIANGGNSVSSFANNGTAQSPANGYGATTAATPTPYNAPSGIAVDQAGSVWVTNAGSNTVTRIFGSAAPVVAPLVSGAINGTTGTKP